MSVFEATGRTDFDCDDFDNPADDTMSKVFGAALENGNVTPAEKIIDVRDYRPRRTIRWGNTTGGIFLLEVVSEQG
jgi:hypothetical protein